MLSIYDQLFLLALNEEKGNILPTAKKFLPHALAGAILAELALQGKVCNNEKNRLEVRDATPTGDEILDEALQEIAAEKPRKLAYWVSQLSAKPKKLRERMGESLAARNVLVHEEKRFFWRQPSAENASGLSTKFAMKMPLRAMILSGEESNPHQLALLNVAAGSNLLSLIFTEDELSMAGRRIHERCVRAALESPAMQTVEEIEQAIAASLEDDED